MAVKYYILVICLTAIIIETSWGVSILQVAKTNLDDYEYDTTTNALFKLHKEKKTWIEAVTTCKSESAYLAMAETSDEIAIITRLRKKHTLSDYFVFVGINDFSEEGRFLTNDGKQVQMKWSAGEPNNASPTTHLSEDCGSLSSSGELNDLNCMELQPFVCKKANVLCDNSDSDYFLDEAHSKCYKLHLQSKKWNKAVSTCIMENSYLAIINSEEEANMLAARYRKQQKEQVTESDRGIVLVGFHDKFEEGLYLTLDGKLLKESGYVKWAANQPDNAGDEDCGMMSPDGAFNDLSCDVSAPFFCERDIASKTSYPLERLTG